MKIRSDKMEVYVMGDFTLIHHSAKRGGCLHIGEIMIRNERLGLMVYIPSTMEINLLNEKYYIALIEKQKKIEGV